MDDSSSEGSMDEEEVLKTFDDEAKAIIQSETLPKKSSDRYLLVYHTYKKWREDNKQLLSKSEENNLIVYFTTLKVKLKPSTLWSIWSMLRKTLSVKDNINITNFINLKSLIKANAKGYKPKKAYVLRWKQIEQFMNDAPDNEYLAMTVILVFGICGCLRCDEITNLKVEDVEDLGNKYLVSIESNKNEYSGQFVIGKLFYNKIKKYISLRPTDQFSNRFFIRFNEGQCYRQPISRHKIGEVPENIASFLNLVNPKKYTGHCFRRTSATLLSDSGANMLMVKQLGRWRSDIIAQGYIENSMHNRQMIYDGVIQKTKVSTTTSEILTDPQIDIENNNNEFNYNINWADFSENFDINNLNQTTNEIKKNKITEDTSSTLAPVINKKEVLHSNLLLFHYKPGIKLDFQDQSTGKRRKVDENLDNQTYAKESSKLRDNFKFDNCSFTNCEFKVISCTCNKENAS